MKWFKHDSNAHTDDKIQKVLMRYGAEGYALYWYCIELIAARVAPDNINFELKHDAEILGYHLKIDTLRVEEIMRYLVTLELFNLSNDKIVCLKLATRLDNTLSQNPQIKETLSNFKKLKADKTRLDKKRIDKPKEKRIPTPKTMAFSKPTPFDVSDYADQQKLNLTGFHDYYTSNNWKVGKNAMKDWQAAARGWSKRQNEYSIPQKHKRYGAEQDIDFDSTGWSKANG